jgi:nucleoside-diphosphate-sugar epimerase
MMNIAIAGSTGFLGKNLSKYLVEKGYNVIPLYTRVLDWEINYKNQNIDVIINLIGKAHDHENKATEKEYYYSNVKMVEQLYEFYKSSTASLFIHISSMAAIIELESNEIVTEEAQPNPISIYGKTKLMAEQYLISSVPLEDKKLFILRPTMIHGKGDKGNLSMLYKIISKRIPYPLGAFKNERSFLSVNNFCFIVENIIEKREYLKSMIYNITDDQPLATSQIIETIGKIKKTKIRIINVPKVMVNVLAFLGDYLRLPLNTKRLTKMTKNLVVSNQKIKNDLEIDSLPLGTLEGLEKTINDFTEN